MCPAIRSCLREARGYSAAEAATILTAVSLLTAAAAPTVDDYVEDAKLVRATHDVRTLAVVLIRLFNDVAAERTAEKGWGSYVLLVGGGAAPATGGADTAMWAASPDTSAVGLLDDHLVTNAAGYTRREPGALFGWRGAYLQQQVQPDPWGHRYAVNISAMGETFAYTLVLSAGPNGIAEAPFELDALPTAGDDIVAVVSSSGTRPIAD